ncbi:MAG TPA: metal ABC transporter substrate-binding protein [Bdellovibrionales bacterium]|nr:metal ABC transporter substrate-binding protein [Bdellovibrionales bacterium]
MKQIFLVLALTFGAVVPAQAKLKIVTTTADLKALVTEVVQDKADVSSIAKGSQDPHYVEAKPSFMVVVRDADLVVANGLSLEIGWLPSLIRGARNPKVAPGSSGYLDLGSMVETIEKPTGQISRAQGDVHPDGNPHFTLDPIRNADLAGKIAERVSQLDSANKETYQKNAAAFKERMTRRVGGWKKRLEASKVTKVVTYHPTLGYFMSRFGIEVPIFLEDKPGIPPTAQHILNVIETMKRDGIKIILVDNFFDTKIADRVAKDVPGARVVSVGVSVESAPKLKTLDDVTEYLVRAIEGQ